MNSRAIILAVSYFILFTALQILIFRNLSLYGVAFSYCYVGAFLLLPIEYSSLLVLLAAFSTGLVTDMFSNTIGVHAFASVFVAFLRHTLLKVLVPPGGYETYMEISVPSMGIRWYLSYMLPLLLAHHFLLFCLEYLRLSMLPTAFFTALPSMAFTLVTILLVQYMFTRPQQRI